MLILCPSCGATYEVPDSRMRPGRRVRCAQCRTDWVPVVEADAADPDGIEPQTPPEDEARAGGADHPPDPPAAPAVSAMDRLAAWSDTRWRGGFALRAAWAASLLLLAGCLIAAIVWRVGVMHLWPPSARLFRALGLAG